MTLIEQIRFNAPLFKSDPVLDEIHRIRAEIAEECGNDLHKIIERCNAASAKYSNPIVMGTPRFVEG